jgi:asparagine synthase (glutamine-hydrolysing)
VQAFNRPAALAIGNPCGLTWFDLATATMLGREPREPLPRFDSGVSLEAVLRDLHEPALAEGPCYVAFSGGRDSAIILAVATRAARAVGHPDPVPVTLRYPGLNRARESGQERLVADLKLRDWLRIDIDDELDIAGPYARLALREVGVLYPGNAYSMLPLLEAARGGWLVLAFGGSDFFGYWYWARTADVLAGRRRPTRRDLSRLAAAALPRRVRRVAVGRYRPRAPMPWLRDQVARESERRFQDELDAVPVRFSAAIARQRANRCHAGTQRAFAALAASTGTRALLPFYADEFLGAFAAAGGRFGFGGRATAMSRLAGGLVPEELLRRSDGVNMQRVFFRDQARAFVANWTGGGVDPEVVDPDVLRDTWSQDAVDWRSTVLLQLAIAHDSG